MNKLKLEPAAALNMLWGKDAFDGEVSEEFISYLDLSSGDELYEKCNSICDWYGEVILNRKYFINNYVSEILESTEEEHLVLILAAGKSPLSLSLLEKHKSKINKVLEIDLIGMDEKKQLYDQLFPEFSEKIKCITADISSRPLLMVLNSLLREYYNNIPCIVILEGIACFLSKDEIENIISSFRSPQKNNQLIVEYLLPEEEISKRVRDIPQKIYSLIKKSIGLKNINCYSNETIKDIIRLNNGKLIELKDLCSIEKERLGSNRYFANNTESWIECAVMEL